MNCEAIMAAATPSAAGASPDAAARFAELVGPCTAPGASPPDEVYVPSISREEATLSNPVFNVLSRLQEFQSAPAGAGGSGAAEFVNTADAALQAQRELLRTAIMMETMNSAKQGVSTLFQLQG